MIILWLSLHIILIKIQFINVYLYPLHLFENKRAIQSYAFIDIGISLVASITSKQRSLSNYSPHNTNSITYDSPLSDATINTPSSNSDVFTPINRKNDKTWRLQIQDDLNKDGSRHSVMHKGLENR